MDIVQKLRIIAETTADGFPNSSIENWMGAAADEIEALRALSSALLAGANKCTEAPHFIVQPFSGIVRDHAWTIRRNQLMDWKDQRHLATVAEEITRLREKISDAENCLVCGALGDPYEVIQTSLKILGEPGKEVPPARRLLAYAVGSEKEPGEIGMVHGPVKTREEALEFDGDDETFVIVRFSPDGTDKVTHRWDVKADAWQRA